MILNSALSAVNFTSIYLIREKKCHVSAPQQKNYELLNLKYKNKNKITITKKLFLMFTLLKKIKFER